MESRPGNLYSTPKKIRIEPSTPGAVTITLDKVIPPIEPPKDTKYIKHIKIQSERLSKFWGRPTISALTYSFRKGSTRIPKLVIPS